MPGTIKLDSARAHEANGAQNCNVALLGFGFGGWIGCELRNHGHIAQLDKPHRIQRREGCFGGRFIGVGRLAGKWRGRTNVNGMRTTLERIKAVVEV